MQGRRKVYKSGRELISNPIPLEADGLASFPIKILGKGEGRGSTYGEKAKVGWGGAIMSLCNPSSDGSIVR